MAAAHRSRALPERLHLKQWKVCVWVLTLKQRAVPWPEPCKGQAAALLAVVIGTGREAQEGQDLGDGDGGTDGGEVNGGAFGIGAGFELVMAGLPHALAAFAGLGELAVACGMDGGIVAEQAVVGGDVADGAVQADMVVMVDEIGDDAARLVEGERHLNADAIALEGFVPTFDLAVGLGIVRTGAHMGHAGNADELLEVLGDELWAVVGDDARSDTRMTLAGAAGWFPRRFPPFSREFPSAR